MTYEIRANNFHNINTGTETKELVIEFSWTDKLRISQLDHNCQLSDLYIPKDGKLQVSIS